MKAKKEWFGEWFDSPYYHVLYQHRDHREASAFIDHLIAHFDFRASDKILDLACGKGRHSIYLNKKGFDVVGVDLSEQNIRHAQAYANERLHFHIHDMRQVFSENSFDYILNMFTSFGYFDTQKEHEQAICAVARSLKKEGVFVLDFLNPDLVVNQLTPSADKVIDGIHFDISKKIEDGFILKNILFKDAGKDYRFQEKVKAINKSEFMDYFEKAGLDIIALYGDYTLGDYVRDKSERMIFVTKKKNDHSQCQIE